MTAMAHMPTLEKALKYLGLAINFFYISSVSNVK